MPDDDKQWFLVRWEMRVLADSADEAEAKAAAFASAAAQMNAEHSYDDFDVSSLKRSGVDVLELTGGVWTAHHART